jgi:UDP-N-acetylglucosamine:LPS N-acetylglucosamine transferase
MSRLLVVLGEGGHSKEMLALVELLGSEHEYSYALTKEDALSEGKIRLDGPRYRVIRPRSKDDTAWVAAGKLALCFGQAMWIVWRARPEAILSSGPAVAIPFAFWGKLFGRAVIFVETGSRVHRLSLTGRLMRRLADLYFVQWPELCALNPKAIYAGRLF